MLIKWTDNPDLEKITTARIKVLKEKLEEAREEDDFVASETLTSAINHLKEIKRLAKEGREIWLDDDDRFVLNI